MTSSLVDGAGLSTETYTSFQDTKTATKRRLLIPNLSFDSPKVSPASLRSIASKSLQDSPTNFLSPPVSIVIPMSPPPRPEHEDYFMSDRKGKGKSKRHRSTLSRKETHSTSAYSEFSPEQLVASPTSCLITSEGLRQGNYQSFDDELGGVYYAQSQSPPTLLQLPDIPASLPPELVAAFDPPIPRRIVSLGPSPAIESLRRLSRSRTQPSIEATLDLKRLSRAVTERLTAVFAAKEASPAVSQKTKRLAFLNRQGEIFNQQARKLTFKEPGGRAPPASITLRKASSVQVHIDTNRSSPSSVSESVVSPFEPPYHLLNSTSNLLAFFSRPVGNRSPSVTSSFLSFPQDRLNSPQSNIPLRNYSLRDIGGQTMARSAALLLDAPPERRRSFIAEAVLTHTIFCPSPASLINPRCQTITFSPSQRSVRASVVRLVSRNSFHEIIWREDEVSSDSTTSAPSINTGVLIRPSEFLESDDNSAINYMGTEVLGAPSPSVMNNQTAANNSILKSHQERESQKALFAWTWEQPVSQVGASSLGKKWDGNAGPTP